jgi:beta-1,4-mannooligosaccharide/beta-1,4-mannosyl-N-acetylglucosamine phosphorylase
MSCTNYFKDKKNIGKLHSNPIMRRYSGNPILTAESLPYPASYAFNAGVTKFQGKYLIAPRVDLLGPDSPPMKSIGTGFGYSRDGINFTMEPELLRVWYKNKPLPWVCDARLTVLEDEVYLSFCFENQHSERPGIARWRGSGVDFDTVCIGVPQQRNMILYPEKINGLYMRLERPSSQWGDPFHIWYSMSPDLRYWGDSELLLGCEDVPFANLKIGGGAPPVKTDRGWLLIFHAVDDDPARTITVAAGRKWSKRYTCGAALFDLDNPSQLIGITKKPLLVAETTYETGHPGLWTEFTVFPCGAVLEDDKGLRIYYGTGDYSTCLAETTLEEIWTAITPCSRLAETATVPFRLEEWKH